MSNDMKSASIDNTRSWYRRDNDVKIEFGFGVPVSLGAMSAHPVFHSAWDIGCFTLYPADSGVGRGNLVLRHFVPYIPLNSKGIGGPQLDTRASK